MKTYSKIMAISVLIATSAFSWPNLKESNNSKQKQNQIFNLTNPSKGEKSYKSKQNKPQLIPLKITKIKNKKGEEIRVIQAKLAKVNNSGKTAGINKMLIEGRIIEDKQQKDKKALTISWQKASYQKKSTNLDAPLVSKISTSSKIKSGDAFKAKGDKKTLERAWKKLNLPLNSKGRAKIKEQNQTSPTGRNNNLASASHGASGANNSIGNNGILGEGINPDFSDIAEFTTSKGCEVRIDLAANLAILQERTIKGDEEIKPCADSAISYEITKNYDSCQNYIDYNQKKVFRQYRLSYFNPDIGGDIAIQDCTIDEDALAIITEDYESCSLRHDFERNYSIPQKRNIYYDGEAEFVLQDCHDGNEQLIHHITNEGCEDKVIENEVIISGRKYVYQGDEQVFITNCIPNDARIEIHQEACEENPYLHDFASNQSFRNKNYFYYKDNQRVDITNCLQSDESMAHQQEIDDCGVTHDDENRQSIVSFKTYIEDNGATIYIKDCTPSSTQIPYGLVGSKWQTGDALGRNEIRVNNLITNRQTIGNRSSQNPFSVPRNCHNNNANIWQLASNPNITLDINYSNESLEYDYQYWHDRNPSNIQGTNNTFTHNLVCRTNYCNNLIRLDEARTYSRYDNSEYIDQNQIISYKYVCGQGSSLLDN